jgi:hypothetical protein
MTDGPSAPAGDPSPDPQPLDRFHGRVQQVFKVNDERIPPVVGAAIDRRRLLAWEAYATPMFALEIPPPVRRGLGVLWGVAAQTVPVHVANRTGQAEVSIVPHRRPTSPTLDSEVQATTTAEFGALLRLVRQRSGLTVPKVAEAAGLPRSQAYALVSKDRAVLPVKGEQVEAFVRACGLSTPQVERVLRLWTELRGNGDRDRPAPVETTGARQAPAVDELDLLVQVGLLAAVKAAFGLLRTRWRLTGVDVLALGVGVLAVKVAVGRRRLERSVPASPSGQP